MEGGALFGFDQDINAGPHEQTGFDETRSCAFAFCVMKQLIQRCLQDAIKFGNVFDDALLQHLYRWLCRNVAFKIPLKSSLKMTMVGEGKKLLVLDIDYILFDHRSTAENPLELMRPYLHEFLSAAYSEYDIILWSATRGIVRASPKLHF
ncbi:hypothetical protein IFM89_000771 [Coptis chinensis]|uniref:FCP1 homology domain-containing protein n=1 Tax=Coptis chinensis TaxID=261450 RepID=A0A835IVZ5_9MAGN|nr:hypothetical protein IFM89_000771 [Coptis chinensis]